MKKLIFLIFLFLSACSNSSTGSEVVLALNQDEIRQPKNNSKVIALDMDKQQLLKKIIEYETKNLNKELCYTVASKTNSFPQKTSDELNDREEKNDNSEIKAKKSRFSLEDTINYRIASVPEIIKNSNAENVAGNFFAENKKSIVIDGLEKYSCEKDGFTSDAECREDISNKSEKCRKPSLEHPEITFSTPYLDPATNLVFVYKHWSCGDLCAKGTLLIYEFKNNGELEYKYGYILFMS